MRIVNLCTNHLVKPLGYDFKRIHLSWNIENACGEKDKYTRVVVSKDEELKDNVFDSGECIEYGKPYMDIDISLEPKTRYYWCVTIADSETTVTEVTWFETGKDKDWHGQWIGVREETKSMPEIYRCFNTDKNVKSARVYAYGLGLYEAYMNDEKLGDEYLMPGYHSYDLMMEYQTFDVTDKIHKGENKVSFILGDGWYKGRFVFEGGYENIYGEHKCVIAELHITYEDGTTEVIYTDNSYKARETAIKANNIYDGEIIDENEKTKELKVISYDMSKELLIPRANTPIKAVEEIDVQSLIRSERGELILDFGQIMTGWVVFNLPDEGEYDIKLQYGEVLQNGCFYNENLRTAKQEFVYKGQGKKTVIRPHFTYYGFRYVKVEGIDDIDINNFKAWRIMSDIRRTGCIKTSNDDVNKLIENSVRSQMCNFLDVPTDCPQRDERLGWTGDISIFAATACSNMESSAFLNHYMVNLRKEQLLMNGSVPFFVPYPKIAPYEGINPFLVTNGATVWADAATIVPWEMYLHNRDIEMLREHYQAMTDWAEHITRRVGENDKPYLWQNDMQLGDWLALDNGNIHNPIGATDSGFIASAFYYLTVMNCYKAAVALGYKDDEQKWSGLANSIKKAFIDEYFDNDGNIKGNETQTAYAVVIAFGLYEAGKLPKIKERLRAMLEQYSNHLSTGFVGTRFLCDALSLSGMNDLAYTLLLNDDYPSWLREVKLGATTIWERWNSLEDDGTISGTGMNSLNHYAYGCIVGWMYQYMCGFRYDDNGELYINPMPDRRIPNVTAEYETVFGKIKLKYNYENDCLRFNISIPFQASIWLELPDNRRMLLKTGEHQFDVSQQ